MIKYVSTRGESKGISSAEAIIKGLSDDKGLYVPTSIPRLKGIGISFGEEPRYKEIAKAVIGSYFDDFSEEELDYCIDNAYDSKFEAEDIVSIKKAGGVHFLELYHGKTSAFKDMALSILPYLLTTSAKKLGDENKICILTATSGDTGKAALEGFHDVPGTEIIVFYPRDGVSDVQKAQMITQEGSNVHVFAIEGNFDDAQSGVKQIFNDEDLRAHLAEHGIKLSSANSINVGRLIPQIAYYVYSYAKLVSDGAIQNGDEINIVVPTGNFGNILAAYYAHLMGVPVNRFICASNENKVLTDFINSGTYDARRDFYLTNSPSMDILISSNLERLLYLLSGAKAEKVKALMDGLDKDKHYTVDDDIRGGLSKFYGGFANVDSTNETIKELYNESKYLVDTHTAVAYKVYKDYVEKTGDKTPTIIASTASPFKFAGSAANSIGLEPCETDFEYVEKLSKETGISIPAGLKDLDKKDILHNKTIEIGEMENVVSETLGLTL